MNSQADVTKTQKVIRLVEYLTRLASLRTKIVRSVDEYERVLWIKDVPKQKECFSQSWGRDEDFDPDIWLEIQTRREPELPSVPTRCSDWADKSSLRNKSDLPSLLPGITRQVENPNWADGSDEEKFVAISERLAEHPEIQKEWDRYVEDKWHPWSEDHNAWEKVHKVYSSLFAIHQEQVRLGEEYELIVGLGLLTWQTPTGQRVRRHLVVADAILEFEARLGKFTLRPHTEGAKLRPELDMLGDEQPVRAEETAKTSLASAGDDPWEKACVEGVLQALVHSISSQGEYKDFTEAKNLQASSKPIVENAPALILRKRSSRGLTETLRRIKERIENGEDIPGEFADLAEIKPEQDSDRAEPVEETKAAFDGELFFPKPSNAEQRRIVEKIRAANGVLVQGPPGTGKSHTIANLVCHLLATGNRILVTAKTPRALQVLLGKIRNDGGGIAPKGDKQEDGLIPKEMKPLCIGLLGSGLEEKRSLEFSVSGILRKYDEWNETRAKSDREGLVARLCQLREEKARLERRLREIRESEAHSHSIAGGTYRGTGARIAEAVNRDRIAYEWLTDNVPVNESCPVFESDLGPILAGFRHFTSEKRERLSFHWPKALPSAERMSILFENVASAAKEVGIWASGANDRVTHLLSKSKSETVDSILVALCAYRDARAKLLSSPHSWMLDAIRDAESGNTTLWRELSRATRQSIAEMETLAAVADETRIDFPDGTIIKLLYDDVCILKEHMQSGGKLTWCWFFRPQVVKERIHVLKTVRINGRPCSHLQDFSLLADVLRVRLECEKTWSLWTGKSEKHPGPYSLQVHALKSLCEHLEASVSLEGLIENCREAMRQCAAIGEPVWSDGAQIEELIASCGLALAHQRLDLARDELETVEAPLAALALKSNAHPVTHDSLAAIRKRDLAGYAQAASIVHELQTDHDRLSDIDERVSKISRILPRLTDDLRRTCGQEYWDERLHKIQNAWQWAQARYWIEEYIKQGDVPALAKRAKQIEEDIHAALARLASIHAWSHCFNRLDEAHRRHMTAWQKLISSLTKSGKGKRDFRNRQAAQRSLNECKDAVPAWVMPLHRVWDTVDPAPGMFDVIIVDEASQCGFEALPLLYLGKKVLIVGDDKQISPSGEFQDTSPIDKLMNEFLYDFQFKEFFDINRSLFEHGQLRYGTRQVILREHFRCMPEIIRFSNDLCYSNTPLIPLRQFARNRLRPLERVFVSGGYREGSNNRTVNRPEASAIVEKIVELCADKRYANKTMGVIVLQGEAQADLIERQLLDRLGAEEMERRRLICGNAYSFQGDERDIIFLSMVAANNERIGAFNSPADERRFNVAASRARDQMFLFHSVTREDLSASCLRRRLLEFFEGTQPPEIAGINREELERRVSHDNRTVVKAPIPFESWFEVDVALELARQGFKVIPQYEIAGKRIDLVVEGGRPPGLAVECDGDEWHGIDQYERDAERQRQLERCECEFVRIRESAFYANKAVAMQHVWRALEERGILPAGLQPLGEAERAGPDADDDDEQECDEVDELQSDIPADDLDAPSNDSSKRANGYPAKHVEDVSAMEIQDAILRVLAKCPNRSSTLHSMTTRVLRELNIITRGNPRAKFEQRVKRNIKSLEERELVEGYKAKNPRVRLLGEPPDKPPFALF